MPLRQALPGKARVLQVLTHVAVACGAVLLVVWLQGRGQGDGPAQGPVAATTPQDAVQAPGAPSPTAAQPTPPRGPRPETPAISPGVRAAAKSAGGGGVHPEPTPPLRILTTPSALRVWQNTEMRLEAVAAPSQRFVRFVWHFGDGAAPGVGARVRHVFPESVADRHVSLEATRADGSKLVISRRVPIERLEVVPLDGQPLANRPPAPRGTRLVLLGECDSDTLEAVMIRSAGSWGAAALLLVGGAELGDRARSIVDSRVIDLPVLRLDVPNGQASGPALVVVRDETGEVKHLIARGRDRVRVLGPVALVTIDSRGEEISEDDLRASRADLEIAAAYSTVLLLSDKPLSPLLDAGPVAPQAYRIYEAALRGGVLAVISGRSRVAWDGRFGGVSVLAVGRAAPGGCPRLMGNDRCQPPTVTLLDISARRPPRVTHVLAADLDRVLPGAALPAEVGKYRR